MEAKVYNQKGKESGKIALPESVFGLSWNADLVHQVVTGMQSNQRTGTANAKTRGEVRGGGKKPWRQKGTGRARHGSTRSPIWIGGGVTHGPLSEKNYTKKINKKMKVKALFTVLSEKNRHGEILFVDAISLSDAKTKFAGEVVKTLATIPGYEKLAYRKANTIFIALPEKDESVEKSFRNLGNVTLGRVSELNPLDVLNYRFLVVAKPEESVGIIGKKLTSK